MTWRHPGPGMAQRLLQKAVTNLFPAMLRMHPNEKNLCNVKA